MISTNTKPALSNAFLAQSFTQMMPSATYFKPVQNRGDMGYPYLIYINKLINYFNYTSKYFCVVNYFCVSDYFKIIKKYIKFNVRLKDNHIILFSMKNTLCTTHLP